jgi:hypothetical protein
MHPDPGRAELAATRRAWTPVQRVGLAAELREQAVAVVWAGLREREAALGRLDNLERARFVLSRLYPTLRGPRLDAILADLAARQAAGSWAGFTPPPSFAKRTPPPAAGSAHGTAHATLHRPP